MAQKVKKLRAAQNLVKSKISVKNNQNIRKQQRRLIKALIENEMIDADDHLNPNQYINNNDDPYLNDSLDQGRGAEGTPLLSGKGPGASRYPEKMPFRKITQLEKKRRKNPLESQFMQERTERKSKISRAQYQVQKKIDESQLKLLKASQEQMMSTMKQMIEEMAKTRPQQQQMPPMGGYYPPGPMGGYYGQQQPMQSPGGTLGSLASPGSFYPQGGYPPPMYPYPPPPGGYPPYYAGGDKRYPTRTSMGTEGGRRRRRRRDRHRDHTVSRSRTMSRSRGGRGYDDDDESEESVGRRRGGRRGRGKKGKKGGRRKKKYEDDDDDESDADSEESKKKSENSRKKKLQKIKNRVFLLFHCFLRF